MRKAVLCLLACLPVWSAASARVLDVTQAQMARLGIRTVPVRPAETQSTVSVLGRVMPAPDSRIPVSAPFAGAVERLLKLEGARVKKGDALAVIVSADMQFAQAKLKGLEARYQSARAAATRARALVDEGIAPASRAEEADAEAASVAADLAASRRAMAQAAATGSGSYHLLAPADGRISAISISAGEQVAAMQPALNIDTKDEMWIEGQLPANAIGRVTSGDRAMVEELPGATGLVMAAGTSIDPRNRSATVRVRLNAAQGLVSGQTVRMTIQKNAEAGSFNVPRVAVVELKNGPALFVARPNGFEPMPVKVLARGPSEATVQGGLKPKDAVAVSGVAELKAASQQD
jgi:cobalt-zinc-cadmium efflux system membrane fusion protein